MPMSLRRTLLVRCLVLVLLSAALWLGCESKSPDEGGGEAERAAGGEGGSAAQAGTASSQKKGPSRSELQPSMEAFADQVEQHLSEGNAQGLRALYATADELGACRRQRPASGGMPAESGPLFSEKLAEDQEAIESDLTELAEVRIAERISKQRIVFPNEGINEVAIGEGCRIDASGEVWFRAIYETPVEGYDRKPRQGGRYRLSAVHLAGEDGGWRLLERPDPDMVRCEPDTNDAICKKLRGEPFEE